MSKQLSMTQLKKENQIYNETVDIDVTVNGEDYVVKLKPFIPQTTIRDLVNERLEFSAQCKKENVKLSEEDENELLGYFIVKATTDIKFTSSKKAKTIYNEFKEAIKSKLFKVILQSIPEETMKDIMDYWFEVIEMSGKLEKEFMKLQDEFKGTFDGLENKEVIENAFKNKNDKLKNTPIQ